MIRNKSKLLLLRVILYFLPSYAYKFTIGNLTNQQVMVTFQLSGKDIASTYLNDNVEVAMIERYK